MSVIALQPNKIVFEGREYIRDTLNDEIGKTLKSFYGLHHRKKEWSSLKTKLIELMDNHDYVFFTKYGHYYPNTVVGESYLHKVSIKSVGALKPFRGRWVRIACIGSGQRWNRDLAAGVINDLPYNGLL